MTTQAAGRDTVGIPAVAVRRTTGEWLAWLAGRAGLHLSLVILTLIWLVPTVGLLITSLRPKGDILGSGWWTILAHPDLTLANYTNVIVSKGMGQAFFNSIAITVPATILPVLLAALAAFAFAWIPFPGRDALFLGVIALLVIPIQMTFVPVLQLLNPLGLTKSYAGIWLAHTAFGLPFAIFLLRNFFILLPSDLIESARIDGANNLSIFFRIIVPLSVPAIASLTIFQFLGVWNDLLMALVFIQNPNARPLTVAISGLQSTYGVEWDLLSAGAFVLMVVPLIVFFSLQRYFVQGLLAGSVK
ncbi:MAG TPA: carbohydrate ABC transporter permease [Chloroflexia bacterium]|nr:carbohydrate ABC transporter permease [Chloroflexia bacterium]